MTLERGAYDSVITASLAKAIDNSSDIASLHDIDAAEAPEQFARLIADATKRAIALLPASDRVANGAQLTNEVLAMIGSAVSKAKTDGEQVVASPKPQMLTFVSSRTPTGEPIAIEHPQTPLAQTSLLTNAPKEPTLLSELQSELDSADEVDIIGAFITFSGIRHLTQSLKRVTERGGRVRVMTTTFTGTTELRALQELEKAGAEVRVSYDRSSTRLHAKAWLFRRSSGFTTTYIGSSNLTHTAQIPGLEWNVRTSVVSNPAVVEKFEATFESYWNDYNFLPFDEDQFTAEKKQASAPKDQRSFDYSFVDLMPKPFQEGLLEQVAIERALGNNRNLIVSATGTGKTVMAAIDYRNLRKTLDRSRLLFVAHRKEILKQSLHTFRTALKDGNFGELWVDGDKPTKWEAVFASVQSMNAATVEDLQADHFDVVIVDEFHHAAAPTYRKILEWFEPKQMLALTATPERTDGMSVLGHFNGRITAELRLWDALGQGLLCPFHYFGISDGTDLSKVKWQGGYDTAALTSIYTADDFWVGKVLKALQDHVADPLNMRALGFCASIDHSRFMAEKFRQAGLKAVSITGETNRHERAAAISDLRNGNIQAIFAVDVFNEGVDIPEVDTVMFLRPTESATVFLQQLGRGLRRTDDSSQSDKAVLTVLDFVGHQRKEFRFDQRFRKMLGGTRTELEKQVENDFPFLPAGCAINLDSVAKEAVLQNIRDAIPTGWLDRKREARTLGDLSLADFLEATGLELPDIYTGKHSFTELRREVGYLPGDPSETEKALTRAIGRLLHINDTERLGFYRTALNKNVPPRSADMSETESRLLTMLHYGLWGVNPGNARPLDRGFADLWAEPEIKNELRDVMQLLQARASLHEASATHSPLHLHSSYSRDEVLAAFNHGSPEKPPQVREGVKWLEDQATDLLFVTLNKSEKDYSPSTMYHDYAISRELFHWDSQSNTTAESKTGSRYINHKRNGSHIALFVRNTRKDSYGNTAPYVFLGNADYLSHTGKRPMSITWRLHNDIPVDQYLEYRAAVA